VRYVVPPQLASDLVEVYRTAADEAPLLVHCWSQRSQRLYVKRNVRLVFPFVSRRAQRGKDDRDLGIQLRSFGL
jgi:hypothetical protein